MAMTLLDEPTNSPALDPMPILPLPVLFGSAPKPTAVLLMPLYVACSASPKPTAVLLSPSVLLDSAVPTTGRVGSAGRVATQRSSPIEPRS